MYEWINSNRFWYIYPIEKIYFRSQKIVTLDGQTQGKNKSHRDGWDMA